MKKIYTLALVAAMATAMQAQTLADYANAGDAAMSNQKYQEAIDNYTKAAQIDPKLLTAWLNLSSAYNMIEETEKAVEAARQAITLEPDSAMGHNNLAVSLYFAGDFAGAKQHMDRARELGYSVDPRFADALRDKV